jgi:hypothetical protein
MRADAHIRDEIARAGRNCLLALRLLEFAELKGDLQLAAMAATCAENESARAFSAACEGARA